MLVSVRLATVEGGAPQSCIDAGEVEAVSSSVSELWRLWQLGCWETSMLFHAVQCKYQVMGCPVYKLKLLDLLNVCDAIILTITMAAAAAELLEKETALQTAVEAQTAVLHCTFQNSFPIKRKGLNSCKSKSGRALYPLCCIFLAAERHSTCSLFN